MQASRIAIISSKVPPEHSGAGLAALKYSSRLQARGELTFLLTATGPSAPAWDLGDEDLMQVLKERTLRVGTPPRSGRAGLVRTTFDVLTRGMRVIGRLRREREHIEVVHCFSPSWLSFFAAIAAKLFGKKLIVEITLLGGDCPESSSCHRFRPMHQRRMFQFKIADAIVCISPALKESCLRAGIPSKKLFVIPRAVDTSRFCPVGSEEKAAIRRRLGLPEDLTLILFVGGLTVRKGIDLLLPAFEKLASQDARLGLVIVGPSHKSAQARSWSNRIHEAQQGPAVGSRIVYPGWRTNIEEYMKAADIFTLPSRREGFGNVFIEALASGLPTVCLNIPGITDFIFKEGKAGYIAETADVEGLAAAMESAVGAIRANGSAVGEKARRAAVGRFSPAKVDALYNTLYEELANEGR